MSISNHGAMSRLHKTAGVLIAPFLIVAALSGFFYALAPSIESVVYKNEIVVSGSGEAHSLDEQIAAAQKVYPDLAVSKVQAFDDSAKNTRVLFADDALKSSSYAHAVFVDPATLEIKGDLVQYGSSRALPLRSWISEGHRRLWLGDAGRIYSELAASWLGALAIMGIYLWLKRRRKAGKMLTLHSKIGAWLLPGFVFLTITGLTWSLVAGENISTLREKMDWMQPKPAATAAADPHAEHHHHMDMTGDMNVMGGADALAAARSAGLTGILDMTPPSAETPAWTVTEARQDYKLSYDAIAVDPHTGEVVDRVDFKDWPLMAKVVPWLIQLHMGTLFGIYNQVVLALLALGLLAVSVMGLWMWFSRPKRALQHLKLSPALVVGAVLYSIIAPLFGASLVLFFLVDWAVQRAKKAKQTEPRETQEGESIKQPV